LVEALKENHCLLDFNDAVISVLGRRIHLKSQALPKRTRRVLAADNVCIEARSCAAVPVHLTRRLWEDTTKMQILSLNQN
jgi:hypothetical protein